MLVQVSLYEAAPRIRLGLGPYPAHTLGLDRGFGFTGETLLFASAFLPGQFAWVSTFLTVTNALFPAGQAASLVHVIAEHQRVVAREARHDVAVARVRIWEQSGGHVARPVPDTLEGDATADDASAREARRGVL
ncbi:hypothetical protein MKK84_11400 [Methylobacterium sp. E-065]|uniref:hypothetical protein n=1 Tax=Methylobacterium sp. E-065 TaxID=2836583 RepID=UPI001FBAD710|nr:hypothetical protein [Methylobacterium sp. E-065]MCJ2018025.1 hypothetical protein [Methylobacterium sp. E-065]